MEAKLIIGNLRDSVIKVLEKLKANEVASASTIAEAVGVSATGYYFERALKTVKIDVVKAHIKIGEGMILGRPVSYYRLASKKPAKKYRVVKSFHGR